MTAELEERFHEAVAALEVVTQEQKAPDAWRDFDHVALEDFWRAWPEIRAWCQWLYQLVDNERGDKAAPASDDSPYEEIGGSG